MFLVVPKYAVLDPEMTRDLPPGITSTTGMDALTHAVEAYLCWTYNTRESIRLAEEAVCGIFRYLERAYRDGNDMEARTQMLIASYKSGFAFTRAGCTTPPTGWPMPSSCPSCWRITARRRRKSWLGWPS